MSSSESRKVGRAPLRVIVTGGRSGIGRAIAEAFAGAGHRVVTCSPNEVPDTDLAIDHVVADVAQPGQVDAVFAFAAEKLGGLDVLVNNAGVSGPSAGIEEISPEEWQRTLDVNLSGPFLCARRAAPVMKEQRHGIILNIGTTSARMGLPGRTPYIASKAGLHGLTRSLARELGAYNVRCNTVSPGMVDNERNARIRARRAAAEGVPEKSLLANRLNFISMRSMVSSDEVAQLTLFLASDAASHISGQDISVCGNLEWE